MAYRNYVMSIRHHSFDSAYDLNGKTAGAGAKGAAGEVLYCKSACERLETTLSCERWCARSSDEMVKAMTVNGQGWGTWKEGPRFGLGMAGAEVSREQTG